LAVTSASSQYSGVNAAFFNAGGNAGTGGLLLGLNGINGSP